MTKKPIRMTKKQHRELISMLKKIKSVLMSPGREAEAEIEELKRNLAEALEENQAMGRSLKCATESDLKYLTELSRMQQANTKLVEALEWIVEQQNNATDVKFARGVLALYRSGE